MGSRSLARQARRQARIRRKSRVHARSRARIRACRDLRLDPAWERASLPRGSGGLWGRRDGLGSDEGRWARRGDEGCAAALKGKGARLWKHEDRGRAGAQERRLFAGAGGERDELRGGAVMAGAATPGQPGSHAAAGVGRGATRAARRDAQPQTAPGRAQQQHGEEPRSCLFPTPCEAHVRVQIRGGRIRFLLAAFRFAEHAARYVPPISRRRRQSTSGAPFSLPRVRSRRRTSISTGLPSAAGSARRARS